MRPRPRSRRAGLFGDTSVVIDTYGLPSCSKTLYRVLSRANCGSGAPGEACRAPCAACGARTGRPPCARGRRLGTGREYVRKRRSLILPLRAWGHAGPLFRSAAAAHFGAAGRSRSHWDTRQGIAWGVRGARAAELAEVRTFHSCTSTGGLWPGRRTRSTVALQLDSADRQGRSCSSRPHDTCTCAGAARQRSSLFFWRLCSRWDMCSRPADS